MCRLLIEPQSFFSIFWKKSSFRSIPFICLNNVALECGKIDFIHQNLPNILIKAARKIVVFLSVMVCWEVTLSDRFTLLRYLHYTGISLKTNLVTSLKRELRRLQRLSLFNKGRSEAKELKNSGIYLLKELQ